MESTSSPPFVPPIRVPVGIPTLSRSARSSLQPWTCRASGGDDEQSRPAAQPKRDPIAEWVARAKSQGRARRSQGDSDAKSPASANRVSPAVKSEGASFGGRKRSPPTDVRYTHENTPLSKEQRRKWFDDLKRAGVSGDANGDEDVFDSRDNGSSSAPQRRNGRPRSRRRRTVSRTSRSSDDGVDSDDGFSEAFVQESKPSRSTKTRASSNSQDGMKRSRRPSSKPNTASSGSAMNSAFARLLDIARKGGSATNNRSRNPDFESLRSVLGSEMNGDQPPRMPSRKGSSSAPKKPRSSRVAQDSDVRKILDLTRRSQATQSPRVFDGELAANEMGTDAEEGSGDEDDMLRSIGIKVKPKTAPRRSFSSTRRVGGRTRPIHAPPADWAPMSEEEIGQLRSESAPLAPRRPVGAEVVRDCPDCHGTGLEMCRLCVGTGWVEPLHRNQGAKNGGRLREEIRLFWETPNLVIHNDGSAQCTRCNGIGKQLCGTCEGSGSALYKGFNPEDKYKEFDMFQTIKSSPEDEEEEDTEIDLKAEDLFEEDDDEEDVDDADADSNMIYTGDANGLGFSLPHLERSALDGNAVAKVREEEEDMFEFSNGVLDEEWIDIGAKPRRRKTSKRHEMPDEDYVAFSNEENVTDSDDEYTAEKRMSDDIAEEDELEDDDGLEVESELEDDDSLEVGNELEDDDGLEVENEHEDGDSLEDENELLDDEVEGDVDEDGAVLVGDDMDEDEILAHDDEDDLLVDVEDAGEFEDDVDEAAEEDLEESGLELADDNLLEEDSLEESELELDAVFPLFDEEEIEADNENGR